MAGKVVPPQARPKANPLTDVPDHRQSQMHIYEVESLRCEHCLAAIPSQAHKLDDVVARVQRLEQAVLLRSSSSHPPQLPPDVSTRVRLPNFPLLESICAYFPLARHHSAAVTAVF